MKKIAFHTFGCRTNQEESTAFAASFRDKGYEIVKEIECADIVVINSCSVTGNTESKVKRFIKSLSKKHPTLEIAVTGCLAQQLPEELEKITNVGWIIGNSDKKSLPTIVDSEEKGNFTQEISVTSTIATPDVIEAPQDSNRTRFSVKLQEGCNHYCSFCIVPYLRGPSRSVPMAEILETVQKAYNLGYKEMVLTGTHIGQFRDGDLRFIDLIKAILEVGDEFRLRLSSMNPSDCSDELFELMIEEPRICRHLHVSAQSLSVEMLKMMKRSSRAMKALFPRIKEYAHKLPDLSIGGDFIVGFPGETEQMFQDTVAGIQEYGFSYGHVFKYSPRPGTPAAEQADQVSDQEKDRRSKLLRDILSKQYDTFVSSLVGREEDVIIEVDGALKGITGNYLRINHGESTDFQKNRWCKIAIDSYDTSTKEIVVRVLA